jgi:hypothetical protein
MGNNQTKQQLRELLFDKFNRNLCLLAEEIPSLQLETDKYYCPLCLAPFNKDAIYGSNPLLTLEHIIPKNSRGNKYTLTCSKCNNNLGSIIDRKISEHNNLKNFANNEHGIRVNTEIKLENNITIGGSIQTRINKPMLLHMDGNRMNTKYNGAAKDLLSTNFKGSFKIEVPNLNKLAAAYVKSAYLYAFSKLGYPYIFTYNAERIRTSIINQDSNIRKCVLKEKLETPGLYLITHPPKLIGYLVSLPFNTGAFIDNITVILSGFTDEDNYFHPNKIENFTFVPIDDVDILTNKII